MSENRAKVIAAAIAVRAALDALLMELTDEVQEGSSSAQPPVAPVPAAHSSCQHSNRTDQVRTFGSAEHWICDDCGYEFRR